jgi:molybdenum cofactor synthesis domain-containing protein
MPLRPDRALVSIERARAILEMHGTPIERTERLALDRLAGRVLAEPLVAAGDVPPFARAAMDGYAVAARETHGATTAAPAVLRVIDMVYTGSVPAGAVAPGTCAGIATGAPLPPGADAVVMVEHTSRAGDEVHVYSAVDAGQHVSPRGGDIRAGDRVLDAGAYIAPSRAGVIAAVGLTEAVVYARPRVAVLSTGDEVVPPGRPLGPGQIHDVNSTTLAAVIAEHGGEPSVHPPVRDDRAALDTAFDACLDADLVLVSGGSSVGERDFVLDLLESRGEIRFSGVAVKPGKPTIFAVVHGIPAFGMSGNPTSCLTNAYLFVAPLLRRIARLPTVRPRTVDATLSRRVFSPAGRHQFYPVRLRDGVADPSFKGSGEITSLAAADGYFEIEADRETAEAGERIRVVLF